MYTNRYASNEPPRLAVDAMEGAVVIEFGAPWCGYCIGAQSSVEASLSRHSGVEHLKIEDGRGRALGRSFRVKLWPTLVFLRDGVELARVVRPVAGNAIDEALDRIDPPANGADPASHA